MSRVVDLVGKKFGRLRVLTRNGSNISGNAVWLCVCDCGQKTNVPSNNLKSCHTTSCGCLGHELRIKHGYAHRKRRSRVYNTWADMIQRCTNSCVSNYPRYGGRGITVCERWLKFENFLEDMGKPPTDKHQIDRTYNDEGYCKQNCRWVTRNQNQRNTRRNRLLTFFHKTQCMIEWAEETGISASIIWQRLKRGWSTERALTEPMRRRGARCQD